MISRKHFKAKLAATRLIAKLFGLAATAFLLVAGAPASAGRRGPTEQSEAAPLPVVHQAQVEIRSLITPCPVRGSDGALHLAYELRITSFQSDDDPLRLTRIQISAGSGAKVLSDVEGRAIYGLLTTPAGDSDPKDGVPIPAGMSRTLFLWMNMPEPQHFRFLRHRLTFLSAKGVVQIADDVRIPVSTIAPISIAAPLRGGLWLAAEGPGNHLSHHWGSMTAINGRLTIPQRFAIDWFCIDDRGHVFGGSQPVPSATTDADWFGYGQDVLAVADGIVVDARDGVADGRPLAPQESPADLTSRTLYGNFVVLKIGPKIYAHYAHLGNGSIKIRIGQHVRRGTVMGRLGQSGAAGAPHLHFQLSDSARFEQSEGVPYVIARFARIGHGALDDMLDPARAVQWRAASERASFEEMPLDGDIVHFP